jgi:hypothetical protein
MTVNIELEETWKEAAVFNFRRYPNMCSEKLRETTKHLRIGPVPAEIRAMAY